MPSSNLDLQIYDKLYFLINKTSLKSLRNQNNNNNIKGGNSKKLNTFLKNTLIEDNICGFNICFPLVIIDI